MESTLKNMEVQKSGNVYYTPNHLAEESVTTLSEVTQPVSRQIVCTVLENDSVTPQISNVQVIKHQSVTSSEKPELNITTSVSDFGKIHNIPSSTDKVSGLIQNTTTNTIMHIQPTEINMFDGVKLQADNATQSSTTRATLKRSSEQCLEANKYMKSSPAWSQEKLSKTEIENTTRIGIGDSNCNPLYTRNNDIDALCSENKKTTHENVCSDSKEDEKKHLKNTGRNNSAQSVQKEKTPRSSNKKSNFPVPVTINQYGECLKTKVGMQSYGITLFDPPCQFFRGVLKGSSGQTLAVMFGDTDLFSKLEQVPKDCIGHFAIDTTFRVIPDTTEGVNNVVAIILLFQNKVIPLWYAVTSCLSPELYKRIILEFQQYVLDWPFTSILLNNDPNLVKAVQTIFPKIEFHGSWFHYCFSIWNEVRANNLVEECKSNEKLMRAVKMLMVIPFLPSPTDASSNNMLEGFQAVKEFTQENSLPESFLSVLNYVDSFWFNKILCKNFTLYSKKIYIIRYIEMFQTGLLSFVKPDGNIWTLTNQFRSLSKEVYIDVIKYLRCKPISAKITPRWKHISVISHKNFTQLVTKKYGMETFLDNSVNSCNEFFDIVLHPMYPTSSIKSNISKHVEGWKIKIVN